VWDHFGSGITPNDCCYDELVMPLEFVGYDASPGRGWIWYGCQPLSGCDSTPPGCGNNCYLSVVLVCLGPDGPWASGYQCLDRCISWEDLLESLNADFDGADSSCEPLWLPFGAPDGGQCCPTPGFSPPNEYVITDSPN